MAVRLTKTTFPISRYSLGVGRLGSRPRRVRRRQKRILRRNFWQSTLGNATATQHESWRIWGFLDGSILVQEHWGGRSSIEVYLGRSLGRAHEVAVNTLFSATDVTSDLTKVRTAQHPRSVKRRERHANTTPEKTKPDARLYTGRIMHSRQRDEARELLALLQSPPEAKARLIFAAYVETPTARTWACSSSRLETITTLGSAQSKVNSS